MNYENLEAYELLPEISQELTQEMNEYELAHELVNLQSEAEINQFLGSLVSSAWRGAKALYNSPLGQAAKGQLVSGLKSLGRKALPALGGAVGNYIGGSTGRNWGAKAGNWAAGRYLNEYEGEFAGEYEGEYEGEYSSPRNVQVARNLIRTARHAATLIANQSQSGQPINRRVVRGIITQSARQNFPGVRPAAVTMGGDVISSPSQSSGGTWYRQGNQLILSGI